MLTIKIKGCQLHDILFILDKKGMYVVLKIVILKIIKYNEGYRGANWGVMNGKYFS